MCSPTTIIGIHFCLNLEHVHTSALVSAPLSASAVLLPPLPGHSWPHPAATTVMLHLCHFHRIRSAPGRQSIEPGFFFAFPSCVCLTHRVSQLWISHLHLLLPLGPCYLSQSDARVSVWSPLCSIMLFVCLVLYATLFVSHWSWASACLVCATEPWLSRKRDSDLYYSAFTYKLAFLFLVCFFLLLLCLVWTRAWHAWVSGFCLSRNWICCHRVE